MYVRPFPAFITIEYHTAIVLSDFLYIAGVQLGYTPNGTAMAVPGMSSRTATSSWEEQPDSSNNLHALDRTYRRMD